MRKIYVLGSGSTLDYINPKFFVGETVIAVNEVGVRLGLYNMNVNLHTFTHYHYHAFDLAEMFPGHKIHAPMGDAGFAGTPSRQPKNVTFYGHYPTSFDFDPRRKWPNGGILIGSTSVHGAMHLACKLGAKDIVLAGVDCGLLDDKTNHSDYLSGNLTDGDPLAWLTRWEHHLRAVKEVLIEEYGVGIYSLNPFVNLNLEGHTWKGVQ